MEEQNHCNNMNDYSDNYDVDDNYNHALLIIIDGDRHRSHTI